MDVQVNDRRMRACPASFGHRHRALAQRDGLHVVGVGAGSPVLTSHRRRGVRVIRPRPEGHDVVIVGIVVWTRRIAAA